LSVTGVACDPARQEKPRTIAFALKHGLAIKCSKRLKSLLGEEGVSIAADEESNTVFIQACPEKLHQAQRILARLDVPLPHYLTVVPLRQFDSARVSNPLQAILRLAAFLRGDESDVRVVVDERNNAIIIAASEETMQLAKDVLHRLDAGVTSLYQLQ
jgi:hypothetical protein